MNSEVIKVVAGGGKTTESEKILKKESNGLYLAFNNTVVEELRLKGYLCKSVDSLFASYIIPKFVSTIPIIANGSKVTFIDSDSNTLPPRLKGIGNLTIDKQGNIFNRNLKTIFNLNILNESLENMKNEKNYPLIKHIFNKNEFRLTHKLRSDISLYLIENYGDEVIDILKTRFTYIIFDEAQDLKKHLESFAKLVYESDLKSYFLGDDSQNINGGGKWFEALFPTKTLNYSHRCPENNCRWIRENLQIEIYGEDRPECNIFKINDDDVLKYDDGNTVLLYDSCRGEYKSIINGWKGKKLTIKSAKGKTIEDNIVIVGKSMNVKSYYTAITRTKKNVFTTISKINKRTK